jgi:DNA-binding protein HU-beta
VTKADVIAEITSKTGIDKKDVSETLESFFEVVKNNLANQENIYVRGFGSFILKKRAAKLGRNIKRNTTVNIPEHHIPSFKPGKEFMQEVKKIKFGEGKIKKEIED